MSKELAIVAITLTAAGWWWLFARMFRGRSSLTASALAWVAAVFAVWSTLALVATVIDDPQLRVATLRARLALGLVAPPSWWVLALRLADPPWLRRWHLVAFALPAIGFALATLAAPVGGPFLEAVDHAAANGRPDLAWRVGPALWAAGLPYSYALLAGAAIVVLRLGGRGGVLDRRTSAALVGSMALPTVVSALTFAGLDPLPGYDTTSLSLGVVALLLNLAVTDARPFDRRLVAYEAVFDAIPEPALVVSPDGTILEANPAASRMPFAAGAELRGASLLAVAPQLEVARRGARRKSERRVLAGDMRGLEVAVSHLHGAGGRLFGSVLLVHDRREDRAREAELQASTQRDPLTGVTNRRGFEAALATALAQRGERAVGVAFIDLDGFKAVNDTHGHAAGDDVLVEVARRLRHGAREGDVVARFGGDEFALLLPNVTPAALAAAAERVAEALSLPIDADGQRVRIGASVGLASAPRDGGTVEALIAASDARMYRQKVARAAARTGAVAG